MTKIIDKITAYDFLDQLLKDTPQGEWQEVRLKIKIDGDHWLIKTFTPKNEDDDD